jgi:hypothetical protein
MNIMMWAKDQEIRAKAGEIYNWEELGEYELRNIMEFAEDQEIRAKAESELKRRNK